MTTYSYNRSKEEQATIGTIMLQIHLLECAIETRDGFLIMRELRELNLQVRSTGVQFYMDDNLSHYHQKRIGE